MGARPTSPRSRRHLLQRLIGLAVGIPLAGALVAMLRREETSATPEPQLIPADVAAGLSVVGSAIVSRSPDGSIRAFSGRCTHLGCRIDRVVNDQAVCPCHGSRYRADGSVAAGPATRPLRALIVEPDPTSGGWIARAD